MSRGSTRDPSPRSTRFRMTNTARLIRKLIGGSLPTSAILGVLATEESLAATYRSVASLHPDINKNPKKAVAVKPPPVLASDFYYGRVYYRVDQFPLIRRHPSEHAAYSKSY